ncbi:hypothetical protein LI142_16855 [Eubacterium limosum]|uniref:hypothetical protein n=1 Tax=Eubacterium limosum TaxID=1736 RepID=UPI001D06776D|nr:hypothetical protein [Eubacterium limosum]MCB6571169.1 hypothetical protein [Eubacterium limosum]
MRLKRNRLRIYRHCRKTLKKDNEGNSYSDYGPAVAFKAELWPGGGKLQVEMYGARLPAIRNLRIDGKYSIVTNEKGVTVYAIPDGPTFTEGDGLCLYVLGDSEPDYKIIAIRPDRFLKLEAERL